ncbi:MULTISPECIES: hypothetical protein [unclassified Frankia]|uniref:hypothetical protein n=1 Tax=unclassified Frankia TaxID=2632575 RepID=UPI002AD343E5|nr:MULTISPECIES: hypothetical protein [unclassified Frankia]
MNPVRGGQKARLAVAGAVAATLVLAAASMVALAAMGGSFRSPPPVAAPCGTPPLAGTVVNVTLTDRGGGGGGGMMSGRYGPGPMMGGPGGMDLMRVIANVGVVPAGTVSLRALNAGRRIHELMVLPLPAGQVVGQRPVDGDGRIDEAGSLGEASRSCGAGSGDGITAGSTGWTTLTLSPGRYEFVCNLPFHYAAGMYTELDAR